MFLGCVALIWGQAGQGVRLHRQAVASFVLRVAGMTLDPVEDKGEALGYGVVPCPEVVILLALPAQRYGVYHVLGVAPHFYGGASPAYCLKSLNDGKQFHAVVRSEREAAAEFLAQAAAYEYRTPASGARVTA